MQKVVSIVGEVVGKAVDAVKETPKETESHIHTEDDPIVQPRREKIRYPVNSPQKEVAIERPPQPQPSVLAGKYPRLKEIDSRLKDQNKAIFEREKKRDKLKKEFRRIRQIERSGRTW